MSIPDTLLTRSTMLRLGQAPVRTSLLRPSALNGSARQIRARRGATEWCYPLLARFSNFAVRPVRTCAVAYRSELDALGGDRLTGPYRAYRQFFQQSSVESRTTEGDASCEDGASLRPGRRRPLGARIYEQNVNDPSAGSPTDTLLRLLLPLNGRARRSFRPTRRETQGVVVKADRSEGLARSFNR